jgi:hypothetical protein
VLYNWTDRASMFISKVGRLVKATKECIFLLFKP